MTEGLFTGYFVNCDRPGCPRAHRAGSAAQARCLAKLQQVNAKTTGGGGLEPACAKVDAAPGGRKA